MYRYIKSVGDCANLYRDDTSGLAWISDGRIGTEHSVHPSIHRTGSVRGMKSLGYWGKKDKVVRSHGWIFNISIFTCDEDNKYDLIVANECKCECCVERRNQNDRTGSKM